MTVDIILIIILLFFLLMGAYDGLTIQILNVVAVVLAFLLSPLVASEIRLFAGQEETLGNPVFEAASWVAAAFVIYFVLTIVGRAAVRLARRASTTLSVTDRAAGATLGTIKALLFGYIICTAAIMVEVPLVKMDPENSTYLRGGKSTQFFKDENIFLPWQLPDIPKFNYMLATAELTRETKYARKLRQTDKKAADFLRRKEIKELLEDRALVKAANSNDWHVTMADPKVRKLFNNREFYDSLVQLDWKGISRTIAV